MNSDCQRNGNEVQSTASGDKQKEEKESRAGSTTTTTLPLSTSGTTEHRMMAVLPTAGVRHVAVAPAVENCEYPHDSPGRLSTAISTSVAANPGSETSASSDHVVSHIRTNSATRSEVGVRAEPSTSSTTQNIGTPSVAQQTSQHQSSSHIQESGSEMAVAAVPLPPGPVIRRSVNVPSENSNFRQQTAGEVPGPERSATQSSMQSMQRTSVANLPQSMVLQPAVPTTANPESKLVVIPTPKKESKSPSEHRPRKRKLQTKPGQTSGRWTHEEHQAFLEGLKIFGREWKKVAERIPTRTSAQIRSHAQKYFSKLAREETMTLDPESPQPGGFNSISPEIQQPLPPSTQQRVEQILNDPTGAQREVEDTLRALRERYRQLQIRLEQRQRARQARTGGPSNVVENDNEDSNTAQHQHHRRNRQDMERRKAFSASMEDSSSTTSGASYQHQHQADDDMSSVSSHLSASLATLSRAQEFRDDELLAVHVLGEAMPRSASSHDLACAGGRPEESKTDETNQSSSQETSASSGAAAVPPNKTPSPVDSKKRRRSDGGEDDSTNDEDEGMVM
mmetsp:Transcript_28515/g.40066  ORF Transcript_28515/g.40066 Transcript_28515/m.40066 type:complete len:565 (+) Transcript_28515:439-2133(+)